MQQKPSPGFAFVTNIMRWAQAGAEVPEEAAGYLAAAKAKLGLSRLQSVRVHHCAQVGTSCTPGLQTPNVLQIADPSTGTLALRPLRKGKCVML
jgi:hypothetical protein